MRARPTEVAVVLVAGLLMVMWSPSVYATSWAPKAALALLVIGPGLAALVVTARSGDRAAIAGSAFLVVAAVSAALSPAPRLALVGLYNHGTGWLFVAAVVGMWSLGRRASAESARLLGSVVLLAAFVNAAMAWLQVSRNFNGDLFALVDGRPPALLGNPVHASALFLGAFAIVAERWRTERRRTEPSRETSMVLLGLALLFASALEIAGGRIGLGVLALSLLCLAFRIRWLAIPMAIAVAVGVVLALWVAPDDSGAASRVAASGESAFSGRIERWKLAESAFTERPILGEGPGLYRRATSPHNTAAAARAFGSDRLNIDAHNVFVEYLVTTGALGALAFAGWLVFASRGARGELAWFAAFGAVSLLLEPQFVGLTPVLALALGAAKSGPPLRMPRVVTVMAGLAVVVSLVVGVVFIRGDVLLRRTAVELNPSAGRSATRALPVWPEPAVLESRAYKYVAISRRRASARHDTIAAERVAHGRDPSDTGVSLGLANLELADGTRVRARAAFADALRWDPYSVQALIGTASFAATDGDDATAHRLCARAREVVARVHCPIDLSTPVSHNPAKR